MLMMLTTATFVIAYALIMSERVPHYLVALGGAVAVLAIGAIDPVTAMSDPHRGIDWDVILLLVGMMLLVSAIQSTQFFPVLAHRIETIVRGNARGTVIALVVLSALASSVLPNLTIVMMVAPVAIHLAKRLGRSAVPFVLATIFGSNIGGTATLIGDPPNLIIGSRVGISFVEFVTAMGPVALVALVVAIGYLLLVYRRELATSAVIDVAIDAPVVHLVKIPTLVLSGVILATIIGTYSVGSLFGIPAATVAVVGGLIAVVVARIPVATVASAIEWRTLAFFLGLFVLVGSLVSVGALHAASQVLVTLIGNDPGVITGGLLFVSGIASGIVDNIPYVTSMIPVVSDINTALGLSDHSSLWWALAAGADLGGNLTVVGASANIVGVAIAHREGIRLSLWDFAKVGIPLTLVTLVAVLPVVLATGR